MSSTIEKAKNIVIDMLADRKYNNIEEDDENPNMIKSDEILVFFSEELKLNISHIKEFVSLLTKNEYKRGILVYPSAITSTAKSAVSSIKDIKIDLFELDELQYNITKHRLVPKHERLYNEEEKEIRKKYGINLPYMFSTEPVSRYYAYEKGNIIKITRLNGVIAYRVVC